MSNRRKQLKKPRARPGAVPTGPEEAPRARANRLVAETLQTGGEPLDVSTRAELEPRFGHSFGDVRVHDDPQAAASAAAVGAAAYTVGQHLVFGADRYQPSSGAGQELLAHELAHVAQQRESDRGFAGTGAAATAPRSFEITRPGDRFESDARRAAGLVLSGRSAGGLAGGAPANLLAREEGDTTEAPAQTPAAPAQTGSAGGGLTVQEVAAAHGSEQHSSRLNTTYSVPWTCFIENDVLLFEFSNTRGGPCTLDILLEDSEGNGVIGSGSLTFADGDDSTRYLEFSHFPTRASGDVMGECIATVTLTNDANPREGYEIYHRIFRG